MLNFSWFCRTSLLRNLCSVMTGRPCGLLHSSGLKRSVGFDFFFPFCLTFVLSGLVSLFFLFLDFFLRNLPFTFGLGPPPKYRRVAVNVFARWWNPDCAAGQVVKLECGNWRQTKALPVLQGHGEWILLVALDACPPWNRFFWKLQVAGGGFLLVFDPIVKAVQSLLICGISKLRFDFPIILFIEFVWWI